MALTNRSKTAKNLTARHKIDKFKPIVVIKVNRSDNNGVNGPIVVE